jgi:hypothetical protein
VWSGLCPFLTAASVLESETTATRLDESRRWSDHDGVVPRAVDRAGRSAATGPMVNA